MKGETAQLLLIEDSETQALKLMFTFEEQGWEVTHATSAEAGLKALKELMPDLIVVDYFLPGMQGDAFCRQVRLNAVTQHIPILMLTAEASDSKQVQVLDSGADDYLPKSNDTEVLCLRIQALLRKTAHLSTQSPDAAFHHARILAVDDSPTYLEFLVFELQQDGYEVETSGSGEGVLERLNQESFDCVLLDLMMPGLDGIGVCRQIRDYFQDQQNPLPILMLTAHDNAQELSRALEAGADDFVGKSNDSTVLKGRVRALLRRKFSQEEHQRLLGEMIQTKAKEAEHARLAQQAAESRVALAQNLEVALAKIQAANEELKALAYASAHDLQEPLRLISNYSQLLDLRFAPELNEKARQYLHFITENAARMKQQLHGLLGYLIVSTTEIQFEKVSVLEVLKCVLKRLALEIEECQAQISWNDPLPELYASRAYLELLLQHLIQNALHFCSSERPLQIVFSAEDAGQHWCFEIRDNGLGIEKQYLDGIFHLFRRINTQQQSPQMGSSGMGLSICRKIVELHQGKIWVTSEPQKGSSFFFTFHKHPTQLSVPQS